MRIAYADPPYLGYGRLYDHPEAHIWDSPDAHRNLIASLADYDGWALSLSSPSLRVILPMCPDEARVMAWVKPFAVFKPNVNPGYAWEPVIVMPSRRRTRYEPTVRDWVAENITMKRGLVGAKPHGFCYWLFDVLGAEADDEFTDVFPGTGAVSAAWDAWCRQRSGVESQLSLEAI